ncbi:hypothetical protein [Novosphingobium sp. ZW T3_23]|uniref:hypothetical protein n=1 Tax=Novosphingobium sp. ZW T3_23 TaxID=3378084 RepID=UPI0038546586
MLRRAREIRELVANVSEAMEASREIEASALTAWPKWALAEADKLDQILLPCAQHLGLGTNLPFAALQSYDGIRRNWTFK